MKEEKRNILLIGSKGFLGKFLFRELSKNKNYKINPVDLPKYDLTKIDTALKVTKGIDFIINTAGLVLSRAEQMKRPAEVLYNNLLINLQVLEAARINKVKRVILISSITAYPENLRPPFKEESLWEGKPDLTNFSYGVAKRVLETATFTFMKQYNLKINCLIFPNLYGPEDKFNYNPPPLVPNIILQLYNAKKRNCSFIVGGKNGEQALELLYIEDAVKAILLMLKKENIPEILNVGNGRAVKIKDIYHIIAHYMNFEGKIKWIENKKFSPPRYLNTSKMKKYLNWKPEIKIENGLKKTVNWFLERHDEK